MVESINQDDWNGVYYDGTVGEFYMMEVQEDGVLLINPFNGDEVETLDFEEFTDYDMEGAFQAVSESVLRDPSELVSELLYEATNAISGDSSGFTNYMPWNVDFAITATNLSVDEDAPYQDLVD